jgi:hypothetical protein
MEQIPIPCGAAATVLEPDSQDGDRPSTSV